MTPENEYLKMKHGREVEDRHRTELDEEMVVVEEVGMVDKGWSSNRQKSRVTPANGWEYTPTACRMAMNSDDERNAS